MLRRRSEPRVRGKGEEVVVVVVDLHEGHGGQQVVRVLHRVGLEQCRPAVLGPVQCPDLAQGALRVDLLQPLLVFDNALGEVSGRPVGGNAGLLLKITKNCTSIYLGVGGG